MSEFLLLSAFAGGVGLVYLILCLNVAEPEDCSPLKFFLLFLESNFAGISIILIFVYFSNNFSSTLKDPITECSSTENLDLEMKKLEIEKERLALEKEKLVFEKEKATQSR